MRIGNVILAAAIVSLSACAVEPEEVSDSEALLDEGEEVKVLLGDGKDAPDPSLDVVISFHRSCTDPYVEGVGNAATYADASSCQRLNGTWTGFRSWSGYCTGNLANIDGTIRCNP